jgi:hypothetical protein
MSINQHNLVDNVYYDVTITNIDQTVSPAPNLYFNETRNTPFIYSPKDYYLTIIRFTLDTPTVPIFIPTIQPNQPDVNLTIYSITLSYTAPAEGELPERTFTNQTFIQYVPQVESAIVPNPPSTTADGLQNNSTGYYYIYNYQYWVFLVNKTMTICFSDLIGQIITEGYTPPTQNPPVIAFDTGSNKAVIFCETSSYSLNLSNPINIYFNAGLYYLFSSFPCKILSLGFNTEGKNVQIITDSYDGANTIQFPFTNPEYEAIQIFQEYSTIYLWSPVQSIVFCSNSLPIVANNESQPSVFYNGVNFNTGGNNSNIANVITDMVTDQYVPFVIYGTQAQYRLISLFGDQPLYTLDISVYWKDRFSNFIPLKLAAGASATIKVLFTKKISQLLNSPKILSPH